MSSRILAVAAMSFALGSSYAPQQTPQSMTATYDSLADTILAVKHTEASFVRSLIDSHFHAASRFASAGQWEQAATQMALVASEGDNAIGGVRKRLLEGGHHHHADGEAKGIYEPGYVIITRQAKQQALASVATLRRARTDAERQAAWSAFEATIQPLVGQGW